MKKCIICKVVSIVAGIGALNWLLVALFQFNLVATVSGGDMTTIAKALYVVIGLAGAMLIISAFTCCPKCKSS